MVAQSCRESLWCAGPKLLGGANVKHRPRLLKLLVSVSLPLFSGNVVCDGLDVNSGRRYPSTARWRSKCERWRHGPGTGSRSGMDGLAGAGRAGLARMMEGGDLGLGREATRLNEASGHGHLRGASHQPHSRSVGPTVELATPRRQDQGMGWSGRLSTSPSRCQRQ